MCPTTLPSPSTHPFQPRTLQVAWSIQLEPLLTETRSSQWQEREREREKGTVRYRSCPEEEQTNSTMNRPLPTSRSGGLWHLSPQSPTPSHPYLPAPIGALVDVSWQQRSTEARRQNADLRQWSSSGGHGSLTRMLRTNQPLFPEPNVLYPVFPILVGGGVS